MIGLWSSRLWLALPLILAGAVPADGKPAEFYRGLNLNGPALVIDGHRWDGKDAKNYSAEGYVLDNQVIALKPRDRPQPRADDPLQRLG